MVGVTEEKISEIQRGLIRVSRAEIEFLKVRDLVHADQGCVRQRVTAVFEVTLDDVGTELGERMPVGITGERVSYRERLWLDGDEHVVAEVSPEIPSLRVTSSSSVTFKMTW